MFALVNLTMTQFQVDSELISAANLTIQATISRINAEVESLHAQLASLQSSWTGVAAAGFQELIGRWRLTAAAVDGQLAEIGTALSIAAHQYAEIEAANSRLFA
jgi:WXG100 family type VII secretion target